TGGNREPDALCRRLRLCCRHNLPGARRPPFRGRRGRCAVHLRAARRGQLRLVSWRRGLGAAYGLMERSGGRAGVRPLATTMEQTELVGVEGPRLYWRITLWLPLGRRGRYASYAVSTRLLPSGRIEVVGPSGRARR